MYYIDHSTLFLHISSLHFIHCFLGELFTCFLNEICRLLKKSVSTSLSIFIINLGSISTGNKTKVRFGHDTNA